MSFAQSGSRDPLSSPFAHKPDRGWRSLALAVVLALGSLPTAVWAKAPAPTSADVSRTTQPVAATTKTPDARKAQRQAYASREASATEQAKFEGGDSTIWIGGSTLVIVLLVILIVVLL